MFKFQRFIVLVILINICPLNILIRPLCHVSLESLDSCDSMYSNHFKMKPWKPGTNNKVTK